MICNVKDPAKSFLKQNQGNSLVNAELPWFYMLILWFESVLKLLRFYSMNYQVFCNLVLWLQTLVDDGLRNSHATKNVAAVNSWVKSNADK